MSQDYKQIKRFLQISSIYRTKHPCLLNRSQEKAVVVVRMGKIVISVIATTGYNDEILSSPDRRYKRFLVYMRGYFGGTTCMPRH